MPDTASFLRRNQYFFVAGGHGTREKQLTQHQSPVSASALAEHKKRVSSACCGQQRRISHCRLAESACKPVTIEMHYSGRSKEHYLLNVKSSF
jgi:hypothetical protein